MSQFKNILSSIKSKLVVLTLGTALVLAPAGAVVARGNHDDDGHRRGDRNGSSQRHDKHDDRNDRSRSFSRGWWWWNNDDDEEVDPAACAERQESAEARITAYKERAEDKYVGLNNYATNQQAFVTDNNITLHERYAEKLANAQERATEEIEELEAPTIDCEKSERSDRFAVARAKEDTKRALNRYEDKIEMFSDAIVNTF